MGKVVNRTTRGIDWTRRASLTFSLVAFVFLLLMAGLFLAQSLPVWQQAGFGFFTGERWHFRQQQFGALAMIYGTVMVSFIALALSAPVGIGAAIFASEILPRRWKLPVKATVELLAGVPSVIYGLLGILYLRNWVYRALEPFDPLSGDTLLTGGVLLAIMILPTLITLSDDALSSVPSAQRWAARGLGLTRAETILTVALPQAWKGIVASLGLALGRALGEGIAVFMVIGRQDNQLPGSIFSLRPIIESGQTLTSKLVSSETNIAYGDSLHWAAMLGLSIALLGLAGGFTFFGLRIMRTSKSHAPNS